MKPIETLEKLARQFEPIMSKAGYHVGVTGSALYGENPNDFDLVIYEHHYSRHDIKVRLSPISLMESLGFKFENHSKDEEYADPQRSFKAYIDGVLVNFIFV